MILIVFILKWDIKKTKINKKEFQNKIEKKCIKEFRPFANKENFNIYNQKIPSKIEINEISSFIGKIIND